MLYFTLIYFMGTKSECYKIVYGVCTHTHTEDVMQLNRQIRMEDRGDQKMYLMIGTNVWKCLPLSLNAELETHSVLKDELSVFLYFSRLAFNFIVLDTAVFSVVPTPTKYTTRVPRSCSVH